MLPLHLVSGWLTVSLLQAAAPAPPQEEKHPRGLIVSEPGATPGFTLFAPLRSGTTYLIDAKGEVAHSWKSEYPPLAFYLQDDGTLLRTSRIEENPTFFGGGLGGRIQRLAKDGSVLWEYVLSDEKHSLHHDIEPLPNGNLLCIAWELLTRDEAIALGRDPATTPEKGFWPDWVFELQPTPPTGGKIVWEWHAKDHLIQDFFPTVPGYASVPDHPERIDINADEPEAAAPSAADREEEEKRKAEMRALGYAGDDEDEDDAKEDAKPAEPPKSGDWLHMNSVDYNPALDLILLSTPDLCEIWVIDHSTTTAEAKGSTGGRWKKGGDLLYRWGNPANWDAGTDADRQLFYQHQPEWIPEGLPGAGHVLVFNNGKERPGKEYSSVDELVLPFDATKGFTRAAGAAFGPAKPVWSYSDPEHFFSFFISGCQRLVNGNTFICSGKQGRFFEITPQGKILWEYWNPYGGELVMGMGKAAPPPPPPPPGAPAAPPGGPVEPTSCFRATHIALDHPGLKALGVVP